MINIIKTKYERNRSVFVKLAYACLVVIIIVSNASSGVFAIGDAPLGVIGKVTNNGGPVEGASVWLKAYANGEEITSSEKTFSRTDGAFYNMVTIPDGLVVDIQITVEADDVYVELLEGANAWITYEVDLDLNTDVFTQAAASASSSNRPSPLEFEEEVQRIVQGEIDDEFIEQHQIDVVENTPFVPIELSESDEQTAPVEESPQYRPAPEKNPFIWRWEFSAAIVLIALILLMHFLLRR